MIESVLKLIVYLSAFISVILLLPGNILLDIEPKEYIHRLPEALEEGLKPNVLKAKRLFENQLSGPETLAVFNGKIVTGSGDGYIYQIDGNNIKPLIKLVEQSCSQLNDHGKCGRPLGMRFDSKGTLYVVEPNVGVFSVEDIFEKNPKVELVLDIEQTKVLGNQSKFLDDLTIDEGSGLNGGHVLYISDVSVKFDFSQFVFIIIGSDTGRVIKYDINAKTVESIADDLLHPNGVEISDDKNSILFNEFVARQVSKVYIKGPKSGQKEVLIKELPGEPDNIRRSASKQETYWLALPGPRTASNPSSSDKFLQSSPLFRKLFCRLIHLFGTGIEFIGKLFNISYIRESGFHIKNGLFLLALADDSYGLFVEIDKNGQIINSLHSTDGTVSLHSDVQEIRINDKEVVLYLGSFLNNYLGKIVINR